MPSPYQGKPREWGTTRPGEKYIQVEGPGNPGWEARHPKIKDGQKSVIPEEGMQKPVVKGNMTKDPTALGFMNPLLGKVSLPSSDDLYKRKVAAMPKKLPSTTPGSTNTQPIPNAGLGSATRVSASLNKLPSLKTSTTLPQGLKASYTGFSSASPRVRESRRGVVLNKLK